MFSIGEFARHGRVSVRMLRHYDAIGLLRPASVDPATGYRFYQAGQLAELNRIIALKDLGFTLQQVQAILDEKVSAAELRGMLKLRRAEIHAHIETETARLARVVARLLTIEDEGRVPARGVAIKRLVPVRVAELSGTAAGFEPEAITPVIQPLYDDLWCKLCCAGVPAAGPAIAYYEEVPEGDGAVIVHAAVPVRTEVDADDRFDVVDLAEVERAATIIHHGSMDDVLSTGQALARWIDANGYRSVGYNREITLEWSPDPEQWVTELQQPIYAQEVHQMSAEPQIQMRAEQPYVAIRTRVPMSGLAGVGARLGEVFDYLGKGGVPPAGPPFFKYNVIDMAAELEVEGGVPVAEPVAGDGQIISGMLPAGRYATVSHVGHPDELLDVTRSLLDWATRQDLRWDVTAAEGGEHWAGRLEFYLTDPSQEPDMSKWETQLAFKLAD